MVAQHCTAKPNFYKCGVPKNCATSKHVFLVLCTANLQIIVIQTILIISGWWFQPLKKILVSWVYYSQYMEKNHVPNHQPDLHF